MIPFRINALDMEVMKNTAKRNMRLAYGLKLALVRGAVLLVLTGCTHTISLKTVDAGTRLPLAGVATEWKEELHDMVFGEFKTGPTNLPLSGEDGIITIRGVHKVRVGTLILSHAGYVTLDGNYSAGKFRVAQRIRPLSNGDASHSEPMVQIQSSNGCFVVPMIRSRDTK